MPSLRRDLAAMAAFSLLAAMFGGPVPVEAAGMIRASCTEPGKNVYREDIPADAPADRRLLIAAKYPEALCVFLKIDDKPPEYREPVAQALGGLPAEVIAAASGTGGDSDESLATALSVLTGKGGPSLDPGPSGTSSSFSNAWSVPMTSDPTASTRQKPVNLTIGIYKGVAMDDVVAHWKAMQQGTKILSRMTPNMTVSGDVTMLSIEEVQDTDAAALCEEAARVGSGCIAVY